MCICIYLRLFMCHLGQWTILYFLKKKDCTFCQGRLTWTSLLRGVPFPVPHPTPWNCGQPVLRIFVLGRSLGHARHLPVTQGRAARGPATITTWPTVVLKSLDAFKICSPPRGVERTLLDPDPTSIHRHREKDRFENRSTPSNPQERVERTPNP